MPSDSAMGAQLLPASINSALASSLNPAGSGSMRCSFLLPSVARIRPSARMAPPLTNVGFCPVFHLTSPHAHAHQSVPPFVGRVLTIEMVLIQNRRLGMRPEVRVLEQLGDSIGPVRLLCHL